MTSIIPAFLIFLSSFLQDPSGFWIPTASSNTDDYFFKSKYISKVDSKITIWMKKVPKVPKEEEGKLMTHELFLQECDCNNFSIKLLSLVGYTEIGDVINLHNFKDDEISYSAPGSVGYSYVSDICTRFNKKKK